MHQNQQAPLAALARRPDLKLVTLAAATTLADLFKGNPLASEVLAQKDRRRLDILTLLLDAEGVVASGQGHKEGCPSAGQGIKDAQALAAASIGSGEEGHVQQDAGEDFVGLALVTPYFSDLRRDERPP